MIINRIVIDTNVIVAGLRSRAGASFQLIDQISSKTFEPAVSVPLLMEYESVLLRNGMVPVSAAQVNDLLDYICSVAHFQEIHYLWRPTLPDPKDDLVLELAVNAEAETIVTHNIRDFRGSEMFGVRVETPRQFLLRLKGNK